MIGGTCETPEASSLQGQAKRRAGHVTGHVEEHHPHESINCAYFYVVRLDTLTTCALPTTLLGLERLGVSFSVAISFMSDVWFFPRQDSEESLDRGFPDVIRPDLRPSDPSGSVESTRFAAKERAWPPGRRAPAYMPWSKPAATCALAHMGLCREVPWVWTLLESRTTPDLDPWTWCQLVNLRKSCGCRVVVDPFCGLARSCNACRFDLPNFHDIHNATQPPNMLESNC